MKELKDFEEDIYRCSRCGLCQSVCPVFQATKNECAVSRGKFNLLNGIIKQEINLTQRIKNYLDLCTSCNACKNFCPSKINAKEIFLAAKYEYNKTNKQHFAESILNSYTLFKTLLVFSKPLFSLYRLLRLNKLINAIESNLLNAGIIGKRIILLNKLAEKQLPQKNRTCSKLPRKDVNKTYTAIYFEGCFNQYINPETKLAVEKILANANINVEKKDFECCGISYLNDGDIKTFQKLIKKNIKNLDCKFDYILTDCATCNDVLKNYKNFYNNKITNDLANKTICVAELIKNLRFKANTNLRIGVHKPCHDNENIMELIEKIENINLVKVDNYDTCCGFAGKFALKNSEISRKISKTKVQTYVNEQIDIILTTCPACQLGLNQGLAEISAQNKPKVLNLYAFLANYCDIKD